MRINWFSNAVHAATGYGVQTKLIVPRLKALGHDMSITAFYGVQGGRLVVDGIPVYGQAHHPYGQDVITAHAVHAGAQAIISLLDVWVFQPENIRLPWFPWFPIDCEPIPYPVLEKARRATKAITMSKYGQAEAKRVGLDTWYAPHCVETDVFRPINRLEARNRLRLPSDAFVIGMVAANKGNPSRKAFHEQITAFAALKHNHPDALLYLHTDDGSHGGEVIDLPGYCQAIGLTVGRDVLFVDQYALTMGLPDAYMVDLYNALDVLSLVSLGEGFGIPCYPAGAQVQTEAGYRPIEQIAPGERVVTHTGRERIVTETMLRPVENEPLVRYKALGDGQEVALTANHPVLLLKRNGRTFTGVRRAYRRGERPSWQPAGEIEAGDFLFMPRRQWQAQINEIDLESFSTLRGAFNTPYRNNGIRTKVSVRDVANRAGVSYTTAGRVLGHRELDNVAPEKQSHVTAVADAMGWKKPDPISTAIPLNEDTGFLFGLYAAEGSTAANGVIEFASHAREVEVRERVRRIVRELWGLETRERLRGNGARLWFVNKALAKAFDELCGHGARNKHLPPFTFANSNFARGFLIGAWTGDGHFGKTAQYATSSPQLARGMRQLANALGFFATVQHFERRDDYVLIVAGEQIDRFLALFGRTGREKVMRQRVIEVDDGWLVPVASVKHETYTGVVYNLEVDEDHSYCVNELASHNCIEAQACGTPIVTGEWTAMGELCFSGWKVGRNEADPVYHDGFRAFQFRARPEAILDRYEAAYRMRGNEDYRKRARDGALAYDADRVVEKYWVPILDGMREIVDAKPSAAPAPVVVTGGGE